MERHVHSKGAQGGGVSIKKLVECYRDLHFIIFETLQYFLLWYTFRKLSSSSQYIMNLW